jgi:hypothetical protein
MPIRIYRACKLCLILLLLTFLATLILSQTAHGQGLELHGGWAHVTGDSGTDGLALPRGGSSASSNALAELSRKR